MNKIETRRFWLACCMIVAGIILLFLGFYTEPTGTISSSVLGASGEIFVFAGAILGLDNYVDYKIRKQIKEKKE